MSISTTQHFKGSFYVRRSQKDAKRQTKSSVSFWICAARKMLAKLTPGVDFTNILRAASSCKYDLNSCSVLAVCIFIFFEEKILAERLLMKCQ